MYPIYDSCIMIKSTYSTLVGITPYYKPHQLYFLSVIYVCIAQNFDGGF